MTRGTTPTYRLIVDNFEDMSDHSLYVTIEQGCVEQTFSGDQLTIEDNTITVHMTQEQTLMYRPDKKAKLQLRGITPNGEAYASQIVLIQVNPILKDGVIS